MKSIIINNLTKTYGKKNDKVLAVDDVSFDVNHGEIFGLIGPDGAGKTSIFRMLTTVLLPDSGSAAIENLDMVKDYKEIRKILGYMPGRFSLYQDLTIEENKQICFNYKNMQPLWELENITKQNKILIQNVDEHINIIKNDLGLK